VTARSGFTAEYEQNKPMTPSLTDILSKSKLFVTLYLSLGFETLPDIPDNLHKVWHY
jgi:hypothetical protein